MLCSYKKLASPFRYQILLLVRWDPAVVNWKFLNELNSTRLPVPDQPIYFECWFLHCQMSLTSVSKRRLAHVSGKIFLHMKIDWKLFHMWKIARYTGFTHYIWWAGLRICIESPVERKYTRIPHTLSNVSFANEYSNMPTKNLKSCAGRWIVV